MVTVCGRRIARLAVVGGHEAIVACAPCGGCRQRIHEFADADTRILLLDADGAVQRFTIDDLLPASFGPNDLMGKTNL